MRKKLVVIAGFVLMTVILSSACSNNQENVDNTTTATYHVHTDGNGETYTHQNEEEHKDESAKKEDTAKKDKDVSATVSGEDAIKKIQEFSAKKLGLEKKKSKYSFLASTESKEIDGKKYIEVIASIINKNDDETVSIDTKGTYYVSEDGNRCLKKNMETGEMDELK